MNRDGKALFGGWHGEKGKLLTHTLIIFVLSQQQSNPQWQCCDKIYTAPTLGFSLGLFLGYRLRFTTILWLFNSSHHPVFYYLFLSLKCSILYHIENLRGGSVEALLPNISYCSGIILLTSLTPSHWLHYILRQPIPLTECVIAQWAKSLYF